MYRRLALALLGCAAAGGLSGPQAAAQDRGGPIPPGLLLLAGDWRFDPSRSDDLETKIDQLRNGGRAGVGPRSGGIGGSVGGRPGGGFGGNGTSDMGESLLRTPVQLSLEVADSAVRMRVDLGLTRPLFLDGRTTVDTLSDMSERRSSARWKKDRLEVERKAGRFGKVREDYRVDGDTGLLLVRVTVEGPRKLELTRVYQRVGPPPGPAR